MRRMYSENQLKQLADSRVEALVEGGTLDNAKPIYCHPITIDNDDGTAANPGHLALLIFDNSSEEYNTYEKLVAKLNSIFTVNAKAVFPITGALYYTSGSALHVAQKIAKPSTVITVFTVRPNGTQGYFGLFDYFGGATIYDGVNKIN